MTEALRRAIIDHDFAPGERLTATMLAERFSVSHTPLREAFARLAGEGWVSYVPQRGVRVADVSADEMIEIYELRELLEPMAIHRSAVNGGRDWRTLVFATFEEMAALAGPDPAQLEAKRYDEYEAAHSTFHRVLVQECRSQWMVRVTGLLSDQCMRFRRLSLSIRGRFGSVVDEHDRLCRTALAGDADGCAQAATVHLGNTRLAILDWLGETGGHEGRA